MKIKKGDSVKILQGNQRGKVGEVLEVVPRRQAVVVKGINVVKKHLKAQKTKAQSGIVDKTLAIAASRVAPICPSCGKATRIKYTTGQGHKARQCRRCQQSFK